MNKDILKQIILDNRVEVERYKVFRREVDMSSFPCYVLVGLRRAGKSFMLGCQVCSKQSLPKTG